MTNIIKISLIGGLTLFSIFLLTLLFGESKIGIIITLGIILIGGLLHKKTRTPK